jgi:hypothetical protein
MFKEMLTQTLGIIHKDTVSMGVGVEGVQETRVIELTNSSLSSTSLRPRVEGVGVVAADTARVEVNRMLDIKVLQVQTGLLLEEAQEEEMVEEVEGLTTGHPVETVEITEETQVDRVHRPVAQSAEVMDTAKLHIKDLDAYINMKYSFYTHPVTFCIIRDYYTEDEVELLLDELDNLKPELQPPEVTGSAMNIRGEVHKKNNGVFIENNQNIIVKLNRKLFGEVSWELAKNNWFYSYLKQDVYDRTLVSYYEDGGYYKPHRDKSLITAIYYVWKDPKTFEGGDLYFGDFRVPIEKNCLLVFPSSTEHEVKVVKGSGRWAISQFVSLSTEEPPIYHFPNFLHVTDFQHVQDVLEKGSWKYIGRSLVEDTFSFWNMDLIHDKFFTEYLKTHIENVTRKKFRSVRSVYANGQTHGQDGSFHQDDIRPGTWTFLLYTNILNENELERWGGMTQFNLKSGIVSQLPIPNHGILFKSEIVHRGLGPAIHVSDIRKTIAWKLIE